MAEVQGRHLPGIKNKLNPRRKVQLVEDTARFQAFMPVRTGIETSYKYISELITVLRNMNLTTEEHKQYPDNNLLSSYLL